MDKKLNKQRGVTLVELMVVIVIIGLISVIVVPNVFGALSQANVKKASTDLKALRGAVEMYRIDLQSLPPAQAGLQALVEPPRGLRRPDRYRPGGYIDSLPDDPWGQPYVLLVPGGDNRAFEIISYGRDGRPGGEGLDADIYDWQN